MAQEAGPGAGESQPMLMRGVSRRRMRGRVAVATLMAAWAIAGVLAAGTVGSSAATPTATRRVPTLLPGLDKAVSLGPAAPGTVRTIGVGLSRPDPGGEEQLYQQLYDPASPEYHQFLTPAQFDARFGVPAAQTKATETWLTSGGLKIQSVSTAGDYLTATGTDTQLERLFATPIGSYRVGSIGFVANGRAPEVPVDLPVSAVVGLDTLHRFWLPQTTGRPLPASAAAPGQLPSGVGASPSSGSFSGVLQPRDLWSIYDQPSTDLGQGQTLGLFGEGETDSVITQLRLFEQHESLPKVPARVVRTEPGGNADYGDNSGNVEWYLDSQAMTGMSPDASQLDLYFSRTLFDPDIFQSFKSWADDPAGPKQMNASFGECEANPTNPLTGPLAQQPYGTEIGDDLEPIGEPILRQATLEGRTLFAATGDTGSGCPEAVLPVLGAGNGLAVQPVPTVDFPAASPYAVAVGGTVITTDGADHGQRQSEVSWTYTGGGSSDYIPEPGYQKDVAAVDHQCLAQPDGTPYASPTPCRGIPDVADLSGNVLGNAYFIYIDGQPSSEGGTSLSSPLMVGMWTRLQAAAPPSGLGFANETLYRQGTGADYHRDFYDVTSAETPLGDGLYRPAPGWDYTSGFGAPDVGHLLSDVDHTLTARYPAPHQAPAATAVCPASVTSPAGNATDPVDVQLGNDPTLDLTAASLLPGIDGRSLVATISGPTLAPTPPLDSTGTDYYLLWWYKGTEYFANAHVDPTRTVSYASGNTNGGGYTTTANTKATGTFAPGKITIVVPLSEVGSPPAGAQLGYPFALDQLDSPVATSTADTAASPSPAKASRGQALALGGCH